MKNKSEVCIFLRETANYMLYSSTDCDEMTQLQKYMRKRLSKSETVTVRNKGLMSLKIPGWRLLLPVAMGIHNFLSR